MDKVILITYQDKGETYASHGINVNTLETIILPPDPLQNFNPEYDKDLDEYVILL